MLLLCLSGRGRSSGKAWTRGRSWTTGQPGTPRDDHAGQSGGKLSVIYGGRHSASRCLSAFSACLEIDLFSCSSLKGPPGARGEKGAPGRPGQQVE